MLKLEDAFDTIRFMFGDASSISFHKKIKKTNYYIKSRRASYSFPLATAIVFSAS